MNKPKIELLRKFCGKPIYLGVLDSLEDSKELDLPPTYYRALVILGSESYTDQSLRVFVENLLESGCRYIMTFGTDGEKLHNVADLAIVDGGYEIDEDDCILTTSHELIEEAIWYAGNLATFSSKWDSELSPLVILMHGNSMVSNIKELVLKLEYLDNVDFSY